MDTNINKKQYPKALIERFAETHGGKTPQEIIAQHEVEQRELHRYGKWIGPSAFMGLVFLLGGFAIGSLIPGGEPGIPHTIGGVIGALTAGLVWCFLIHLPICNRYYRLPGSYGGRPVYVKDAEECLRNIEWVMKDLESIAQRMGKDTLFFTFGDFRHGAKARMGVRALGFKDVERALLYAPDDIASDEDARLQEATNLERRKVLDAFSVYHALHLIEGRAIKWLR